MYLVMDYCCKLSKTPNFNQLEVKHGAVFLATTFLLCGLVCTQFWAKIFLQSLTCTLALCKLWLHSPEIKCCSLTDVRCVISVHFSKAVIRTISYHFHSMYVHILSCHSGIEHGHNIPPAKCIFNQIPGDFLFCKGLFPFFLYFTQRTRVRRRSHIVLKPINRIRRSYQYRNKLAPGTNRPSFFLAHSLPNFTTSIPYFLVLLYFLGLWSFIYLIVILSFHFFYFIFN